MNGLATHSGTLGLLMEWPRLERMLMWNCGLVYEANRDHRCQYCREMSDHRAPIYLAMVWR